MNSLKGTLLSSSDEDPDSPPPRKFLRRRAKMPVKGIKRKESKRKESSLDRQEKKINKLNPSQRRYCISITAGLAVRTLVQSPNHCKGSCY